MAGDVPKLNSYESFGKITWREGFDGTAATAVTGPIPVTTTVDGFRILEKVDFCPNSTTC